ncbi:Carboxypeptidase B [Halotydeus destructor]|nr:Carboxypeptidase B [Halotydeus destructor]
MRHLLVTFVFLYCTLGKVNIYVTGYATSDSYKSYANYWLVNCDTRPPGKREALMGLKQQADHFGDEQMRMWTLSHEETDVLVGPERQQQLMSLLKSGNITYKIKTTNMGSLIDGQRIRMTAGEYDLSRDGPEAYFKDYRDFKVTEQWCKELVRRHRDKCKMESIGKTYEGRDLWVITCFAGQRKPVCHMQANIHAREWITTPTLCYFMMCMLDGYGHDQEMTELGDSYEFHIMPCVNPDGYSYSRTTDRLWRKNKQPLENTNCVGVDLNRNFPIMHGEEGASRNPCSLTYCGPSGGSELEAQHLMKWMMKHAKGRCLCFFDVHCYSQLALRPYGYKKDIPYNEDALNAVGGAFCNATSQRYGTQYEHGSSAGLLYAVSGGVDDWCHETVGCVYPFTIECPDKGKCGFVMDKCVILPIGKETCDGFKAALRLAAQRHGLLVSHEGEGYRSSRLDGINERRENEAKKRGRTLSATSNQATSQANPLLASLLAAMLNG